MQEACTLCKNVGASAYMKSVKIKYGEQYTDETMARGWTTGLTEIYDLDLHSGRSLTDTDIRLGSDVVVIGADIADKLLPGTDPLGKDWRQRAALPHHRRRETTRQGPWPKHGQLGGHPAHRMVSPVRIAEYRAPHLGQGLWRGRSHGSRHGPGARRGAQPPP